MITKRKEKLNEENGLLQSSIKNLNNKNIIFLKETLINLKKK